MALTPPKTPFDSFTWLKNLVNTMYGVINRQHQQAFACEALVTEKVVINGIGFETAKYNGVGSHSNGMYWLGYYYLLTNTQNNGTAIPWFGCEFINNFSIDIIVQDRKLKINGADRDNKQLYRNLLPVHLPFTYHPHNISIICRLDDYMKCEKNQPNFRLEDWIYSNNNQKQDLEDFFDSIHTKYIVPNV